VAANELVTELRQMDFTLRVAQHTTNRRSAIDGPAVAALLGRPYTAAQMTYDLRPK
jgi:hypothetical protein